MNQESLENLKYPIGKFTMPDEVPQSLVESWKEDIKLFPARMTESVAGLGVAELNWIYRPDGWAIKQVVHHCGDSHMNAISRFKLALTEDKPTIRPYLEDKWAELADDLDDDISNSLSLLAAIHHKWLKILDNLTDADLSKEYVHPEHGKTFTLKYTIGMYAWHSNHHLAHVKQALDHQGKF